MAIEMISGKLQFFLKVIRYCCQSYWLSKVNLFDFAEKKIKVGRKKKGTAGGKIWTVGFVTLSTQVWRTGQGSFNIIFLSNFLECFQNGL